LYLYWQPIYYDAVAELTLAFKTTHWTFMVQLALNVTYQTFQYSNPYFVATMVSTR